MSLCIERQLSSIADLAVIESILRSVHYTVDGAPCQAMLTLEYQNWRNKVVKQLYQNWRNKVAKQSKDEHKTAPVVARLSGFKLLYEHDKCIISQILPDIRLTDGTVPDKKTHMQAKRPSETVCNSIFKKQRICLFPHQT